MQLFLTEAVRSQHALDDRKVLTCSRILGGGLADDLIGTMVVRFWDPLDQSNHKVSTCSCILRGGVADDLIGMMVVSFWNPSGPLSSTHSLTSTASVSLRNAAISKVHPASQSDSLLVQQSASRE
jgi:hypothetical protein